MMRLFATLVLLLILSACSQDDLLQKFSSPADQAKAQACIKQLRSHDYESIERAMDETLKGPATRDTLAAMAARIPAGEPSSVKLVGAHVAKSAEGTVVNSTFEYQFGSQWFLINAAMREHAGTRKIVGLNVVPLAGSLESQNRFSLSGKTWLHYLVLGAAVLSALITLAALVACVRTTFQRRKWLWVLFVLFGLGKLDLNWSTGEWSVTPIALQLFSAGATSQFYGPWIVSVALPVGAICFLFRRRRRARAPVAAGDAVGSGTGAASL